MAANVVSDWLIQNGTSKQTAGADNTVATVTLPAIAGVNGDTGSRYYLTGYTADFNVALLLIKTITVSYTDLFGTATSLVFNWDFTNGTDNRSFPGVIATKPNTAVTISLAASGTSSKLGSITAWYAYK